VIADPKGSAARDEFLVGLLSPALSSETEERGDLFWTGVPRVALVPPPPRRSGATSRLPLFSFILSGFWFEPTDAGGVFARAGAASGMREAPSGERAALSQQIANGRAEAISDLIFEICKGGRRGMGPRRIDYEDSPSPGFGGVGENDDEDDF